LPVRYVVRASLMLEKIVIFLERGAYGLVAFLTDRGANIGLALVLVFLGASLLLLWNAGIRFRQSRTLRLAMSSIHLPVQHGFPKLTANNDGAGDEFDAYLNRVFALFMIDDSYMRYAVASFEIRSSSELDFALAGEYLRHWQTSKSSADARWSIIKDALEMDEPTARKRFSTIVEHNLGRFVYGILRARSKI
jgi:hypothetical protein